MGESRKNMFEQKVATEKVCEAMPLELCFSNLLVQFLLYFGDFCPFCLFTNFEQNQLQKL